MKPIESAERATIQFQHDLSNLYLSYIDFLVYTEFAKIVELGRSNFMHGKVSSKGVAENELDSLRRDLAIVNLSLSIIGEKSEDAKPLVAKRDLLLEKITNLQRELRAVVR
jgi:hypothetical protein